MVLVGFGDQVAGVGRALLRIDAASAHEAERNTERVTLIRLEHAQAAELVGLLNGAYGVKPTETKPGGPRFQAVERTNAILVTARSKDLLAIKDLIATLDSE